MKFIYLTLFSFLTFSLFSQTQKINKCNHDHWLEAIEKTHPGYNQKIQESFIAFGKLEKSPRKSINITIPVHVIIVHPTGQPIGTGSNHSLAHVQSQIDVLNQDFGRYNTDAGNTPAQFPAANTGIQFCLATVDPDGNPTDGITRYAFDGNFDSNASTIRSETRWPRESYSNIWSAPNLPYLGLASVPSQFGLPPANDDFIHVDAATFGGPGFATFPNYDLGRTTTHEMGHWLGLFHVWANNGCGVDDGIADTPLQDDENFGCPNHPSPSCGNSGDMFMNYMDYVNDNCMNAFTQGQGDYMNLILSTSRASLNGSSFTACATSVPLTLSILNQEDPNCAESNDGFILVEAQGGEPDYTYSLNGGTLTSDNLFTDLPGGTYTIEVFDSNGNTTSVTTFLNTPLPLTASINIIQENMCPNDSDASIEIQVAGGSNPYTYALNMGSTQNSPVFEDLSNGFYTYSIVDLNGCMFEDIFELTDTSGIAITIDSTSNLICSNDNMGLIVASAEGGTGPLTYSINGFDYQNSGTFEELDGGDYFVYVQDSIGCYDSLAVTLTEPDPFFLSLESIDVSCFGLNDGSVIVNAMGGNGGPYQYSFDSITFGDATTLDSLVAGEYDLFALDSLGCLAIASFELEEPEIIEVIIDTLINIDCIGDSTGVANLSAIGGNGDYTFIFQGDSTATAEYENLAEGTYEVLVVDSVGCSGTTNFTIGANSMLSLELVLEQNPPCTGGLGGSIQVMASNTQGTVIYEINGLSPQESSIFNNLSAGDYIITATDLFGCTASLNVTLTEPENLFLNTEVLNNVTCNGGQDGNVTVMATGGTPPYQYSYELDGTDLSTLSAGSYTMTVEDANGCMATASFEIIQPNPLQIIIAEQLGQDCDTGLGALIDIDAIGGTGGYDFELSGPSGTITKENGLFDQVIYGAHQVKVTDSNGCETSMEVFITLENMFYASIEGVSDLLCFGDEGGGLDMYVQGGLGSITYLIDGAPIGDLSNLNITAGDYTLSILDENECVIELPFTLEQPEELLFNSDYDEAAGTITLLPSGGVEPYLYSFDGGATFSDNNTTDDLSEFPINAVIQDGNGCEVEEALIIIQSVNNLDDWNIKAYPNPIQDWLILDMDLTNPADASIEIFDLNGRVVYNIPSKKYNTGNNFVKLDLSNFASSIYIVKIASAEGYRYIKVTKM
ncbi:MAG: M43 family zinc metalloprotease [Saprospiraceae bacterium]|nr:M43 family zinc metalloprotease [Saprospiraceae bacterium]